MGFMKDLDGLNAAYASMQESGPMVLTKADKVGNTPAWRNRHKKNVKSGEPLYKMADHLKDEYESELWNTVSQNLTELHQLGGVQFKVVPLDEGAVKKELKALSKAGETGKGKYVKKADEIEEQKDTPDQVKAVIAFDKARKGTRDAVYDTEHGKKKQAKKERDYAKWQRDKGAEDAQKSGHPWEHAKGSTREKEGKKSEKHAHIKDSYQLDKEALNLYHSIYNEEKPGGVAAALTKSTPKSQPDATPNKKVMGAKGETLQKNTANTVHTKVKEGFSSWRDDLKEYTNIVDEPESKADRKVKESKVKNKVVIDPEVKLEQALGGKVESIEEAEECPKCGEKAHKGACVKEEILWDKVAIALTELSVMNDVQFKVVAEHHERDADGNVIEHDDVSEGQVKKELKDLSKASKTLKGKYVAKADEVEEGYQRNPEAGEAKERESAKKREAIPGQARRGMPPRGDKKREEFERWYAANVR